MRQLDCVKCHAPLFDPYADVCDRCRRETRQAILELRERLKAEIDAERAGGKQR